MSNNNQCDLAPNADGFAEVFAHNLKHYRRRARERSERATATAGYNRQENKYMGQHSDTTNTYPAPSEPWPEPNGEQDAFLQDVDYCNTCIRFIEDADTGLSKLHQSVLQCGYCSGDEAKARVSYENTICTYARLIEQRHADIEAFPLFTSGQLRYGRACTANARLEHLGLTPLFRIECATPALASA